MVVIFKFGENIYKFVSFKLHDVSNYDELRYISKKFEIKTFIIFNIRFLFKK